MTRIFYGLLCALLLATAATAQQGESSVPSFKSSVELVVVPAVVTRDGADVHGLKKNDFVLMRDGKAEQIAFFEEVDAVPAKVEKVSLPANTVQNYASADGHQDVVILFLDFLNASWTTSARIRSELSDITKKLAATHTPVSVLLLTPKGLVQIHSFSSSGEELTKAVEMWTSGAARSSPAHDTALEWTNLLNATDVAESAAALRQYTGTMDFIERTRIDISEMTVRAIEQISESFRGIPGRKKLIWLSTGFPTAPTTFFNGDRIQTEFLVAEKISRAWKSLGDANIAVYTVDSAAGGGGSNPAWNEHFSAAHGGRGSGFASVGEIPANTLSLMAVSQRTGGRNCVSSLVDCVGKALDDGTHYYVLGFYLKGNIKPGWHPLKIEAQQPKLSVRSREGFIAIADGDQAASKPKEKPAREDKRKLVERDVILTALASPFDYTSVPLRLSWRKVDVSAGKTQLEFVLKSPPGGISVRPEDSMMNIDCLAFVRPSGKVDGESFPVELAMKLSPSQARNLATTGFVYRKQIPLTPGRYDLRVLVRDNITNKIGTVSTVVNFTP